MKTNRVQYRRNWADANRVLQNESDSAPLNDDSDESVFDLSSSVNPSFSTNKK